MRKIHLSIFQPLDETQTLAGFVTDEEQLFGGISAEGKLVISKLYEESTVYHSATVDDSTLLKRGGLIDVDIIGNETRRYDLIDDCPDDRFEGLYLHILMIDDGQRVVLLTFELLGWCAFQPNRHGKFEMVENGNECHDRLYS